MQEYRGGRVPLIHVDLYRLNDPREIDELGLEELGLKACSRSSGPKNCRARLRTRSKSVSSTATAT